MVTTSFYWYAPDLFILLKRKYFGGSLVYLVSWRVGATKNSTGYWMHQHFLLCLDQQRALVSWSHLVLAKAKASGFSSAGPFFL